MKHLERPWDLFLVIEPPRPPIYSHPLLLLKRHHAWSNIWGKKNTKQKFWKFLVIRLFFIAKNSQVRGTENLNFHPLCDETIQFIMSSMEDCFYGNHL